MSWLRIYQALPYPLQVVAATARGVSLRRWRRGPGFDRKVRAAQERERFSSEEWRRYIQDRLPALLDHAATRVPYYRESWARRRAAGDDSPWDRLDHWPVLRKEQLRVSPRSFVAEGFAPGDLIALHTSGTTGTPLALFRTRAAGTEWYAICEARIQRWCGATDRDRWAVLGGQLVTGVDRKRPPFWVWNAAMRQLYMSSYHLSAANVPHYLAAIERHRIRFLEGYASSLHAIASEILRAGLPPPPLRAAVSYAEPLLAHQRASIEAALRCPVRDTYGMTEIVAGASECRAGTLHAWPDVGVVEILDDREDRALAPGEAGRLVCTGLLNEAMPLIRYETGDRGALEPPGAACACGCTLPILRAIEGRFDDVVVAADGRRVGRLDPVFKADLPIVESQIVQEEIGKFRIRVVPAPGFSRADADALSARLCERVGEASVTVEMVERIERTANGKFRSVISRVGQAREAGPASAPAKTP